MTEICLNCEGASIHPITREQARMRDSCKGMAMMAHHATIKFLYAINCYDHSNELVQQKAMTVDNIFHVVVLHNMFDSGNNQHSLN
jgi:hypothetical protein